MSRQIICKSDLPGYQPPYKWPLNSHSFNFVDKLKISKFILSEDRWTQGEYVKEYERIWKEYTGAKHAIMVSSGSTANELIALRRREELRLTGSWPKRRKVLFPVVTWISSISPWVNFDFEPVFMDVSGDSFNACYEDVKKALDEDYACEISTVFYTSILGFSEDLRKIKQLCDDRGVALMLDNCESSFSYIPDDDGKRHQHICSFVTSSTSFYFSHLTTTGTEGGMIFCNYDEEAEWYKMARSHGMTRGLPEHYKNLNVDPAFDFYMLGSNYRSHNLAAYMGMIDFDRALKYSTDIENKDSRIQVSNMFSNALSDKFYHPHSQTHDDNVPFALPIVLRLGAKDDEMPKIRKILEEARIESRPFVSGNLLRQTAFKKFGDPTKFPCAEWLHKNGCYVGLHKRVKHKDALSLAYALNEIVS